MTTKKELIPAQATHPGVLIKDEIDATPNLNQKILAKQLDVKPSFFSEGVWYNHPKIAPHAPLRKCIVIGWTMPNSHYKNLPNKKTSRTLSKFPRFYIS